jgi:hypothetical protein
VVLNKKVKPTLFGNFFTIFFISEGEKIQIDAEAHKFTFERVGFNKEGTNRIRFLMEFPGLFGNIVIGGPENAVKTAYGNPFVFDI